MYDRRIDGPYVGSVWMSHRVQPCKERVHPLYEYTGRRDPTREADGDVPDADLRDRLAKVFDMSGYTVNGQPRCAVYISDVPADDWPRGVDRHDGTQFENIVERFSDKGGDKAAGKRVMAEGADKPSKIGGRLRTGGPLNIGGDGSRKRSQPSGVDEDDDDNIPLRQRFRLNSPSRDEAASAVAARPRPQTEARPQQPSGPASGRKTQRTAESVRAPAPPGATPPPRRQEPTPPVQQPAPQGSSGGSSRTGWHFSAKFTQSSVPASTEILISPRATPSTAAGAAGEQHEAAANQPQPTVEDTGRSQPGAPSPPRQQEETAAATDGGHAPRSPTPEREAVEHPGDAEGQVGDGARRPEVGEARTSSASVPVPAGLWAGADPFPRATVARAVAAARAPPPAEDSDVEEMEPPEHAEDDRPRRVFVARRESVKEWVCHEADLEGSSSRAIRRTMEKLYRQVQDLEKNSEYSKRCYNSIEPTLKENETLKVEVASLKSEVARGRPEGAAPAGSNQGGGAVVREACFGGDLRSRLEKEKNELVAENTALKLDMERLEDAKKGAEESAKKLVAKLEGNQVQFAEFARQVQWYQEKAQHMEEGVTPLHNILEMENDTPANDGRLPNPMAIVDRCR
ncbi:uncharacterized protein [Miscanthus floridulus]|uniref:uncharacterized protein n=1 Tax=Miscanthus floridulus TaxID=154761 RepID=UPI00345991C6